MTRTRNLSLAAVLLLLGLIELVNGLVRADLIGLAAGDLASLLVGWGPFVAIPGAIDWLLHGTAVLKASGLGHEGGYRSIDFYTDQQSVHITLGAPHNPVFGKQAPPAEQDLDAPDPR